MEFWKEDLKHLVGSDEWDAFLSGVQVLDSRDSGLYLREFGEHILELNEFERGEKKHPQLAKQNPHLAHPTGEPRKPVLPFPFTAEDFKAFCDWHVDLEGVIVNTYTNDDDSLDLDNLDALRLRCRNAAALVGIALGLQDEAYFQPLLAECAPMVADATKAQKGATATDALTTQEIDGFRRESAPVRRDKLLWEILIGLGIDPLKIKRHRGGAQKCPEKERARVVALSDKYRQQGFTKRTFQTAWENLPKVD